VIEDTTMSLTADVGGKPQAPEEPALILALNAARPLDPPACIPLGGIEELVLGRGSVFAVQPIANGRLRIDLADVAVSSQHARLVRAERGWNVIDEQSKNGTLLDGRRATSSPFGPDDVLEIGSSFFVLRSAVGTPAGTAGLQTLSPRLAHEFALFSRVAASRVPILITGDTGTGKELLARTAHELSGRGGPFIALNCGALPATLIEGELFGARKGAYSGASTDRIGAVTAADKGTLFLDEIAELPEPSQASLLRFLQEGEVRPLGAPRPLQVDVRVLAATHQNLGKLVAEGRFRDDLHARLRGHVLALPPLRARREDLGLLVASLLPRVARERAAQLSLQRTVARAFLTYDWPHNIRELEQVLARAMSLLDDHEIRSEHVPDELFRRGAAIPDKPNERTRLVELVRRHHGNLSAVARALTTSRSQVRRLLKRHGIERAGADDESS
jgi:DNA-binding NtrC family response regulator